MRDAFDMEARGANEGKRGKPGSIAHRKLGCDPAAEIEADEIEGRDGKVIEKIEIEIGKVGDGVEPGRRVGAAEAGMLGEYHVMVRSKIVEPGKPHPTVARAMQHK